MEESSICHCLFSIFLWKIESLILAAFFNSDAKLFLLMYPDVYNSIFLRPLFTLGCFSACLFGSRRFEAWGSCSPIKGELRIGALGIGTTNLSFAHQNVHRFSTPSSLDKCFVLRQLVSPAKRRFSAILSFYLCQNALMYNPVFYHFVLNAIFAPELWTTQIKCEKKSLFSVACQIANKLSEMILDLRHNNSTAKSALTKYFQQSTSFCFN